MSADTAYPDQAGAPGERRGQARHGCRIISLCQAGAGQVDDFWRRARINDVSAGGISLLLDCSFPIGTVLLIEPIFVPNELPALPTARVVHCTSRANRGFLLGCEFASHLSEAQLQALVHATAPARVKR